jgi:alpha-beta hydrolase superfamily lysophospholipase
MDTSSEWKWMTKDGLEIYSKAWLPSGKPKGVICLLHGVGEHIGRYEAVGDALANAGYILAGFDQRGFGRSQGQRGHTPNLDAYLDDIDMFLTEMTRLYPDLPRFLYGHSMGGILALAYPPLRHPNIAGAIVTSPPLKSSMEKQKLKVFLAKVMGRLTPTLTMDSGLDSEKICRDPKVIEAYNNDPLVHRKVTASWGKSMLETIDLVYKNAPSYPVPLLLMQGTQDDIAYPSSSETFIALAPRDRITLKMWDGFFHELHTDPEKSKVFKVIVDWLDQQFETPPC